MLIHIQVSLCKIWIFSFSKGRIRAIRYLFRTQVCIVIVGLLKDGTVSFPPRFFEAFLGFVICISRKYEIHTNIKYLSVSRRVQSCCQHHRICMSLLYISNICFYPGEFEGTVGFAESVCLSYIYIFLSVSRRVRSGCLRRRTCMCLSYIYLIYVCIQESSKWLSASQNLYVCPIYVYLISVCIQESSKWLSESQNLYVCPMFM